MSCASRRAAFEPASSSPPPTDAPIGSGAMTLDIEVQGQRVPALGFGTWQLSGDEAREATRDALEIGYRQIDTAQAYGNEQEVGRAIAERGLDRSEIFLTTKIVRDSLKGDRVG